MSGELARAGRANEVTASIVDEDDLKVMRAKAMIYPFLSPEQAEEVGRVLDEVFTPDDGQMSDDEIVAAFVSAKTIEGLSPKTIRFYAASVRQFREFCPKRLTRVTADDLRSFIRSKMETTCSAVGADNLRRNLSSFFMWMESEDLIAKSPMRKVKPIKARRSVKKPFDDMEVERIRDACETAREHLIVEFLISSGVRVSELVGLRVHDIDMSSRRAVVVGKGNKEREVHFSSAALMWMRKYLAEREAKGEGTPEFMLVSDVRRGGSYRPISQGCVEAIVRKIGERAGVGNCHPHRFRRTMATGSMRRGMSIDQVRELLGHESIGTTTLYAQTDHEQAMDAARRLIG